AFNAECSDSRASTASLTAAGSVPLSTNFARLLSIAPRARSSIAGATSTRRTENPACANDWAMPLPIVPAPTMPMVFTATGLTEKPRRHDEHEGTRSFWFLFSSQPLDREGEAVAAAHAERRDAAREVALLERVEK